MLVKVSKTRAFLSLVGLLALLLAGQAQAGKNCGGLNQKSCWSPNPSKWCDGNLKYKPTGVPGKGTCVKRKSKPKKKPKKDCGGLNQSSCWSANPEKWCDGDLKYEPTGIPGQGRCVKREAKRKNECGGLGQSSCWHVDPRQWCEGDLQYKPTGVPGKGTCVTREKTNCGNLDQQSCWHVNPKRWCNGGLKYKPTGVPGQGTCISRVSKDDLLEVSASVVDRIKTLGEDNPLRNLRTCLNQPENFAALQQALNEKSGNGVNDLLYKCGASPDELKSYGQAVLGSFIQGENTAGSMRHRSSSSAVGSNVGSLSSDSDEASKAWHLSIAALGSGVAKVGAEGGVGYRLELRKKPEARFYVTGGLSIGIGLAAGADLGVGLSYESMPVEHWASDAGMSVSYSGKAVYGGGVSVDFSKDSVVPSGFTISGGVGGGVEAGVVTGTGTFYLHNFRAFD